MLTPYSDTIEARLTARHRFALRLCGSLERKSTLDLGSGSGWFEQQALAAGARFVCAVDATEASLAQARRNAGQGAFVQASAIHLPVASERLEVTVAFDVLEHVPRGTERQLAAEMYRVLRTGGTVVVSTPANPLVSKALDPAWYVGHRHYSPEDVRRLLVEAGFSDVQVVTRGGLLELLAMLQLYAFKWLLRSEVPFKAWWERKRDEEYLARSSGIATVFAVAVKRAPMTLSDTSASPQQRTAEQLGPRTSLASTATA